MHQTDFERGFGVRTRSNYRSLQLVFKRSASAPDENENGTGHIQRLSFNFLREHKI